MSELPKAYVASECERKWYAFWEERGFFQADATSRKPPYCIVIPPPNVTGVLHMGHALVNTLQDILVRWKRMSGYEVLWQPGTDHAGIATEAVVARELFRTTGKRRNDFVREDFLKHVWTQKERSEQTIISQLKSLGCSCDWSRLRFTLDPGMQRAVFTMFQRLYDQGLLYRGDYLVNWDPVTQTALADDEVEYEERNGSIWTFSYPLAVGSGAIQISTTRPETMLGDVAVAVAPTDPRYSHLVGQHVIHPLTGHHIPIIADDHIDPAFGTGAMKVTPAHDPNDYLIGQRHDLPLLNIMTPDGCINERGGAYAGLTMQEARKAIVEALRPTSQPHVNRVGVSYRSKATIEPFLSKQWFVKLTAFKERLQQVVITKELKLLPPHWEAGYLHWIDNLRDWCISRQLWWGHRIPIWYRGDQIICSSEQPGSDWEQDPDVLDTWFSSALWPFATLGWPDDTLELERFYPNSTLITGHDILFFWVARMVMMGDFAMGRLPFPETFLHGLIYGKSYWRTTAAGIAYAPESERREYDLGKPVPSDVQSRWEKMSKSKGNIIDPIEISNEYGTDAMRMALAFSATEARQIDLDRRRFEEFKNFANKVWNGARFILSHVEDLAPEALAQGIDENLLQLEDRWIMSRVAAVITAMDTHLTAYAFDRAAKEAYEFYWSELCAYYLEVCKPVLFGKAGTAQERCNKQKLLVTLLLQAVRLLHPMAPFITEELFQLLRQRFGDALPELRAASCMVAQWPTVQIPPQPAFEAQFDLIRRLVYAIRNIRGEMKVPPGEPTQVVIVGNPTDPAYQLVEREQRILTALVRVESLAFVQEAPQGSVASVDGLKVVVPLPERLQEQERQRLAKEAARLEAMIQKAELQLADPHFIERAPQEHVAKLRQQLDGWQRALAHIRTP